MLDMHANVVASYLRDGGRITKLTPCVAVTEHELFGYLQTCGVKAEPVDENFNGYLCNGKRVNLLLLLHLLLQVLLHRLLMMLLFLQKPLLLDYVILNR